MLKALKIIRYIAGLLFRLALPAMAISLIIAAFSIMPFYWISVWVLIGSGVVYKSVYWFAVHQYKKHFNSKGKMVKDEFQKQYKLKFKNRR